MKSVIIMLIVNYMQEPLNSNDDLSDEEDAEIFDVDNVVVCQFDKVSHHVQNALCIQCYESATDNHVSMMLCLDKPQQEQVEVPPERRHHESQGQGLRLLKVER